MKGSGEWRSWFIRYIVLIQMRFRRLVQLCSRRFSPSICQPNLAVTTSLIGFPYSTSQS